MAGIRGAELIVEALRREGATTWFGLAGSQFLPLLDRLHGDAELRFVTARHEQGAAYMAYGWARARRGLGVCLATVGPGATNLLSGVAAAYKGRVPLLAYTAKQSGRYHGRDMFQELDQVALYAPVTKLSTMPTVPEQLPTALRNCLRAALTPPYGPAHLNVMPELLAAEADAAPLGPRAYRALPPSEPGGAALEGARVLLERSRRPVIVAGDGVLWAGDEAPDALRRLAERLGAPVATSYHALDAFPDSHALGLGPMGPCGREAANAVVRQADLILDVGGGLDFYSTRYDATYVPAGTPIVQVVDAPERVGAAYPVAAAVVGPVGVALAALLDVVEGAGETVWAGEVEKARAGQRAAVEAALAWPGEPRRIRPEFLMATLDRALGPDDVVVSDSGNAAVFLRGYLSRHKPGTFVDTTNFSAIGSGLPVAIGYRAGRAPGSTGRVVCVTGDGGFALNLAELETAVREGFHVVVVVANDFGFGNVRSYQRAVYGGRRIGSDFANPDFSALARAFGAEGYRVEAPGELAPALESALASGRTAVVDVLVDPDVLCTPLHAAR